MTLQNTRAAELRLQSGNIFGALFGAVLLIGLLGAGITSYIKGPLRSATMMTRKAAAETQMTLAAQSAVMAATAAANNGDCDADGMAEPVEWRDAGSLPAPAGGGLIPATIAVNKRDPWGTEYGYCVWDHGSVILNAACQATSGTNRRLEGYNAAIYPAVAIISAGPDKVFTTTCRNFSTGATRADQNNNGVLTDAGDLELVGKSSPNDDDIIYLNTYQQASASTGGLWSLKTNDPSKATIAKNLEVTGGASFSGIGTFQKLAASSGDLLEVISGLKIAGPVLASSCNAAGKGVIRSNMTFDGWEICNGAAWTAIAGSQPVQQWPILAPDGSATAPSYGFKKSLLSGMYLSGGVKLKSAVGLDIIATRINFAGASTDFRVASTGGVQFGNDTGTCAAALQGTIRFNSSTNDYEFCNATAWGPLPVGAPDEWKMVKAAGSITSGFSCGIKSDGTAWCWGTNSNGQLGNGTTTASNVPVTTTGSWKLISAGGNHNCGIRADGTAWCWGSNTNGQLGTGTTTSSNSPVQSSDTGPWKMVSAGGSHSCGLKNDGTAWCWGFNSNGQLGNGGTTQSPAPVKIGTDLWISISAGFQHSCGIKQDGTAWCWGNGNMGRLGNNSTTSSSSPVAVQTTGVTTWTSLVVEGGGGSHSCGIKSDKTLWCWGSNVLGNLGNGTTTGSNIPVQVTGTWNQISVGGSHTCGVKTDGTGWCWGNGNYGKLGNGTTTQKTSPFQVGSDRWNSITAGYHHSCGIKANGTGWCWGFNGYGQGGNGTANDSSTPVLLASSAAGAAPSAPVTAQSKKVFVTAATYTADFGGAAAADALCQQAANDLAVPIGGTFKAWISDSFGSPATQFTHSNGPYVLLNGTVIANDWADLTDGTLQAPIRITENGSKAPISAIFSGTNPNGTPVAGVNAIDQPEAYDCNGWTSTSGDGAYGNNTTVDNSWSNQTVSNCSVSLPLYCFEQ